MLNPVGTILQLARYPVKSMRGETLPATTLTFLGVPEDRRYAFVQAASRSDFPWLTARQLPDLLRYQPAVEGNELGEMVVMVTTPSGEKLRADSDELRREIEERSGRAVFLLRQGRGCYDKAPISIISGATVARIGEESGTAEDARRFRPNLLVDLCSGEAFDELNWVGRILRVGETARVAITEPDHRCVMITLDPDTVTASPAILNCVTHQHARQAGVYATVITPGEVRTGDQICIEN